MTATPSTRNRYAPLRSLRLPEELERRILFATITVTGTGDTVAADGVVTLREAITSTNLNADANADVTASRVGAYAASPDTDVIHFNIPAAGVHTISPTTALPMISDGLTIDGYSQPGASANTNGPGLGDNAVLLIELDGTSAGANVDGLTIGTVLAPITIRGLAINRFSGSGIAVNGLSFGSIEGNFIGTDPTGTIDRGNAGNGITTGTGAITIGGAAPAARNVISGNENSGVLRGSQSAIQGNFIGTDASGTVRLGNSVDGIRISAPGSAVGGTAAGEGNLISGNSGSGVTITGSTASQILVQGNLIGTDVTGTRNVGNIGSGVFIDNSSSNTVGGTAVGARNIISGNGSSNVSIKSDAAVGSANRNRVQGNYIGTDITGTQALLPLIPGFPSLSGPGVAIYGAIFGSANDNLVGGVVPNAGNVIAFTSTAVSVVADVTAFAVDNLIRGNSIFSNMAGIELDSDGPTPNDPKDADTGPNYFQNFPVIASASSIGGTTTIIGTINSTPGTALLIDFYSSPTIDPSERGQGKTYIGAVPVNTDASGNAIYTGTFALSIPAGQFITATANTVENAPFGSTSEFSESLPVTGPAVSPTPPALSINDVTQAEGNGPGVTAFTFTITRTGDLSGPSSVLVSTTDGTASSPSDYAALNSTLISFAATEASKNVTVNVAGDMGVEPNETFFVNLSGATGATIADVQGLGTITNDDVAPPAPPATAIVGPDPANPAKMALIITGTDAGEYIDVDPGSTSSKLKVEVNDVLIGEFNTSAFDRIYVYAKGGADRVSITTSTTKTAVVFGGDGADQIKGGNGKDILLGEGDGDIIRGRKGRDIIIGGAGADGISGDEDDDLIIAAATTFDADLAALFAFQKEWTSGNGYTTRRDNVRNGTGSNVGGRKVNNTSILEDNALDLLSGNSGRDLFFYHKTGSATEVADKINDKASDETVVDAS